MVAATVIFVVSGSAHAQVRYAQNKRGETTALAGLFSDQTCSVADIGGRVVKREFAEDAITVTGFVLEQPDGTRRYINVFVSQDLDMVTRDIVFDGLQRLLQVGRVMHGQALACGAAGRVLTLEQVR